MLNPTSKKRQLIPQWRRFELAITSNELASPGQRKTVVTSTPMLPELVKRIERLHLNPDLIAAAEVVESSIISGHEREAIRAARVVMQSDNAVPMVRAMAATLLRRNGREDVLQTAFHTSDATTSHHWRTRTRLNPTDAVAWVELARVQACKGHVDHAKRSMKIALQLAPTNRHVLRSATRLYFQFGDPETAHDLVKRNPATPSDPWLMSAEVALSEFSGAKSLFMKKGLELVENEIMIPAQITELAGAVGTIVLKDGSRRGRKLIRMSLNAPTSNSLAQAEWVSVTYHEKVMDEKQLQLASEAWEAKAIQAFYAGAFEQALLYAELWMEEEQYNLSAYATAAGFANVIENFGKAKDIASKGLALKKDAPSLLNALAFSAACQGDLIKASDYLVSLPTDDDAQNAIADANQGLIAMRTGNFDEGRKNYRNAITTMKRINNRELEVSATIYFAYELARAGLADESAEAVSIAKEKNRILKLANVNLIIQRIKQLPAAPLRAPATPPHSSHG
ncbi:hypothetical protein QEV83_13180 [Methylocapsa sp. D3K7]|uniref:tetratricopeptide repeat protein n=1 Tax=Methylocapsa sp. D3K7 TaxID=3041435 RepID=UPI00244E602A|nr:hypothetical protein [Methylocapsa sp. D3K7]WGJ13638.1 hypothetical protein QEV83_13180 [Methylocapsa sp. D3K7]